MDYNEMKKAELIQEIEALKEEVAKLKTSKKRTTQKKQTESLDELKQHFIETVAHELRTPVTPIRSVVDMFLDGMLGEVTDQQRSYLEMLKRNIDRLVHFISEVTTLCTLESGETVLQPQRISVLSTINEALELVRKKAETKQVSISLGTQTELFVYADPQVLATIVINLVDNAIVHNPTGTKVRISTQLGGKDFVRVTVCDNGKGIMEENLKLVFESFLQPGHSYGPGYGGAGIGLSVCKKLVKKMGGSIMVESEEGKGTSFCFTLPVSRRPAKLNTH